MFEFFGTQQVPAYELLAVAEKTTWDSGKDLFSVNLTYSQFDTREALMEELNKQLGNRQLTIQKFSNITANVLFGQDTQWGDKTPDYGFHMQMLQQLWPECRFVHIVRDGISTARSMSRHGGCQLMVSAGYDNWCALSYDRLYSQYSIRTMPLQDFISSWRRRVNRIRDEAGRLRAHSYLELSYEHLVENSARELTRLAEFLDIDAGTDWIDHCLSLVLEESQRAPLNEQLKRRLAPHDLILLNEFGSKKDFPLAVNATLVEVLDLLESGLDAFSRNDDAEALSSAFGALATTIGQADKKIRDAAIELVCECLSRMGDAKSAVSWERLRS